ncbi:MAG: 2-oxo acid dehydrogenase subunit E2 [Gammaproteobacteria bacterium]|nr:2-oxo acid dehydrogenase subunit E2 [Gammaproteobacteria bacterium]
MKKIHKWLTSKKRLKAASIKPYPKVHHIISDIITEGRRKNNFYVVFDADLTIATQYIKQYAKQHRTPVPLMTYIIQTFARAVNEHKDMQTYRRGRSKLMVFNEVDVAVTVEREVEGHLMPILHIVRNANQAPLSRISEEIQYKKTAPLHARPRPFSRTIRHFSKIPYGLRRMVWAVIRRTPYLIKRYMGTVAVSSTSSFCSGSMVFISPSPITLLSIGGGRMQTVMVDDVATERYIVQMGLTVDHDVVDGAPVSRFLERFKQLLQQPDVTCG